MGPLTLDICNAKIAWKNGETLQEMRLKRLPDGQRTSGLQSFYVEFINAKAADF
jgi:hypothetical protein